MSKADQTPNPWADRNPSVIENAVHDIRISGSFGANRIADIIEVAMDDYISVNTNATEQEVCESTQAVMDDIIQWAEKFKAAIGKAEATELKPSDFTIFPCCSTFGKTEPESVAVSIMRVLVTLGDEWQPLTWEEFAAAASPAGNTHYTREREYFDQVMPHCRNAETAKLFSPAWARIARLAEGGQ